MKPRQAPVLVERELWLATKSGERRTVRLTFEMPRFDGRDYFCAVQIIGLEEHEQIKRRVYGVDGVQALELALQHAMIILTFTTSAYREGRLTFLGSPDLGLPFVDSIREHVRAESWARVGLDPATSVPEKLAATIRKYLATYPEGELAQVLEAFAAEGHEHLLFTSDEAANSFRDEVRSMGFTCELEEPPSPLGDAQG